MSPVTNHVEEVHHLTQTRMICPNNDSSMASHERTITNAWDR